MKFDKLPVDNYFRFLDPERNGIIYQRLSAKKIRDIRQPRIIITYRSNEEIQDLGANITTAIHTPIDDAPTFKDVPINYYFKFKEGVSVYQKTSVHKMRMLGDKHAFHCRTRNKERVEILGQDISDFAQPILLSTTKSENSQ
jgi:hypothetical protein